MSKRSIALLALLFLAPVILYFVWPTDENRIRKLFRDGAKAVEERKISDVMSKVSFSYSDANGLSYALIKDLMARLFKHMQGIKIEFEIKRLSITGEKAVADLAVRAVAAYEKDIGYFIGDAATPANIRFFLEKEGTGWQVVKTERLKPGI